MKVWWRGNCKELFHTFESKHCDASLAIEDLFEDLFKSANTLDVVEVKETLAGPVRKYRVEVFDEECCATLI